MADRTPRIAAAAHNLVLASATIIGASSYETSLPPAYVVDPIPSKRWRSKLGWNVVAGVWDRIPFSEGGVARVATIAPGNYATGALYAAAATTAMNTAPGAVNTYAVTYSATTKTFTIARTAGAAALVLLFLTGTDAVGGRSAHPDLGFTSTDKGGASSTAEAAAYHSREYLSLDFRSALTFSLGIFHGHNLGALGAVTLKAKASSDVWVAPPFSQLLAGDALATMRVALFGSQLYRYAILQIDDTGNTDGFSEVGVPFVGSYWQPERGYQVGASRQPIGLSQAVRSDDGTLYMLKRKEPKQHSARYVGLPLSDRDAYQAIADARAHVFFFKWPESYPGSETPYGVITSSSPVDDHGPLGDRFSFDVVVDENLG